MAIGKSNQNSGKNVHYVKVVKTDENKKKVAPYFSFRNKQEDGTYKELRDTAFSGNLTEVKTEDYEYQGQVTPQAILRVEDGNDVYLLSLLYNFTSRSLLNSLLSLGTNTKGLNFNVYETKKNDKGDTFAALALWQGDTMIKWFYQKDELPAIEKISIKGKKDLTDSSKLDDFLRIKLDEKFNTKGKQTSKSDAKEDSESLQESAVGEEGGLFP